jgi:cytochrome c oxidase subunit IV
VLALIVASIKGSLVACYFMHLIDEKITIYWTLIATLVAFLILIFVPLSTMLAQAKI